MLHGLTDIQHAVLAALSDGALCLTDVHDKSGAGAHHSSTSRALRALTRKGYVLRTGYEYAITSDGVWVLRIIAEREQVNG